MPGQQIWCQVPGETWNFDIYFNIFNDKQYLESWTMSDTGCCLCLGCRRVVEDGREWCSHKSSQLHQNSCLQLWLSTWDSFYDKKIRECWDHGDMNLKLVPATICLLNSTISRRVSLWLQSDPATLSTVWRNCCVATAAIIFCSWSTGSLPPNPPRTGKPPPTFGGEGPDSRSI